MISLIDNYFKITKIASVTDAKNGLYISCSPGTKTSLETDISMIKHSQIDVVVCTMEWYELVHLGLVGYPESIQSKGILFYHFPIRDMTAPSCQTIDIITNIIVNHLLNGKNVLVHCYQGLGRSGLICACCLVRLGLTDLKSIELVRKFRRGAIITNQQKESVIYYHNHIKKIKI